MEGDRLEGGDAAPPGDPAGRRGHVGLREIGALEQGVGVTDEDKRGVGQPNPPPGLLEQRDPSLPFEHRKLL